MRGKSTFQTNVGAVFTIINYALIFLCFGYYFYQMLEVDSPFNSAWNQYVTQESPETTWDTKGFGFFILPFNLKTYQYASITEFKKNFTIIASGAYLDENGWLKYKDYPVGDCDNSDPFWKDFNDFMGFKTGLCVKGDPTLNKFYFSIGIYPC